MPLHRFLARPQRLNSNLRASLAEEDLGVGEVLLALREDWVEKYSRLPGTLSAFLSFRKDLRTAPLANEVVGWISQQTWTPVDGGDLIVDVDTPPLNGPVLASISVLFGTLTAATISRLFLASHKFANALLRKWKRFGISQSTLRYPPRTIVYKQANFLSDTGRSFTWISPTKKKYRPDLYEVRAWTKSFSC